MLTSFRTLPNEPLRRRHRAAGGEVRDRRADVVGREHVHRAASGDTDLRHAEDHALSSKLAILSLACCSAISHLHNSESYSLIIRTYSRRC